MALQRERILILAKTYPSPSSNYIETSCVAGVNANGEMRRLFPVPFRLLEDDQQFAKWQWVESNIEKSRNDHRPESFRVDVGTLVCGEKISTNFEWRERRAWTDRLPVFRSFSALESWSAQTLRSLALLSSVELIGIDVVAAKSISWSEGELAKLNRSVSQGDLLNEPETRGQIAMLNKLPCDFYYRYLCSDGVERRHKIVDWEAGQLYRRCMRTYGPSCNDKFKERLVDSMKSKDLMLLLGNQHRFQNQWLNYQPHISA